MSAAPSKYTRNTDFAAFSTAHPGEQQPGVDLDAEFDEVKGVTDAIIDRLAEVQRDDGKLKNLSVHPDALSSVVRAMIASGQAGTPRGDWAAATDYIASDLASQGDATYIATRSHTSSAAFSADLAEGKWMLLSRGSDITIGTYFEYFSGTGAPQTITLNQDFGTNELAIEVYVKEDGSHFERMDPANYVLNGDELSGTFPNGTRTVLIFSAATATAALVAQGATYRDQAAASAETAASEADAAADEKVAAAGFKTGAETARDEAVVAKLLAQAAAATAVQFLPWCVTGGTANALTMNYTPDVALVDGALIAFRATAKNTTTNPTATIDGGAALTIYKDGGGALEPGNIVIDGEYIARYKATGTKLELLNPTNVDGASSDATVVVGSAITLANGVVSNVCSFPLEVGEYEISGVVHISGSNGNTVQSAAAGINTVSATMAHGEPGKMHYIDFDDVAGNAHDSNGYQTLNIGPVQLTMAAPGTAYLMTAVYFSPGTELAFGHMHVRRVRKV